MSAPGAAGGGNSFRGELPVQEAEEFHFGSSCGSGGCGPLYYAAQNKIPHRIQTWLAMAPVAAETVRYRRIRE